jgi:hypothetical protein
MAKLAASTPITHPGPATALMAPASAGPTTNAAWLNVETSALPATRCRSGSCSATNVYVPALPQACSSDDAASSRT